MPLVVVMTSVLPRQTSGVKTAGELPRSNPSIGSPCRSPARSAEPAGKPRGHAPGLVDLAAGDHRLAARGQGVDHHGRRPEHVDHDRHAPSQRPRRDQAPGAGGRKPRAVRTRTSPPPLRARFPLSGNPLRLWHADPPLGESPLSPSCRRPAPPDCAQSFTLRLPTADDFRYAPALTATRHSRRASREDRDRDQRFRLVEVHGCTSRRETVCRSPVPGDSSSTWSTSPRQVPSTPVSRTSTCRRCSSRGPTTRRGRRGRCSS